MPTFRVGTQGESTDAPISLTDDKQSKPDGVQHGLRFRIAKYLTDKVADENEKLGQERGASQTRIDLALLREAQELAPILEGRMPESMHRFNEVMHHFLSGSSRTLYFKMAELLNCCAGARDRVSEAISFRLEHHSTEMLDHPSCDLPTHVDESKGKPINYSIYQFPIHQGDYHDPDWQYALGTFGAMWEPVRPSRPTRAVGPLCRSNLGDDWIDDGTSALTCHKAPRDYYDSEPELPTKAKLWGSKIWRWHSETDRPSEKAHQAAYRLVQAGTLHNFWVIAEPCIVDISTGAVSTKPT
jgi:hypothetical protein